MIISNRKNLFGKCGRIKTKSYSCILSIAKEGILLPLSTVIFEGNPNSSHEQARLGGKLIYAESLKGKERLRFHDILLKFLDDIGENSNTKLGDVLQIIFNDFKQRGIVKEAINMFEKFQENGIKSQILNSDFYKAAEEIKQMLLLMQFEAKKNEQAAYLKKELKKAIDDFLANPCENTAIPMLTIASEFLSYFE